eukprot:9471390-Pyramimonas_sp.AAC.2
MPVLEHVDDDRVDGLLRQRAALARICQLLPFLEAPQCERQPVAQLGPAYQQAEKHHRPEGSPLAFPVAPDVHAVGQRAVHLELGPVASATEWVRRRVKPPVSKTSIRVRRVVAPGRRSPLDHRGRAQRRQGLATSRNEVGRGHDDRDQPPAQPAHAQPSARSSRPRDSPPTAGSSATTARSLCAGTVFGAARGCRPVFGRFPPFPAFTATSFAFAFGRLAGQTGTAHRPTRHTSTSDQPCFFGSRRSIPSGFIDTETLPQTRPQRGLRIDIVLESLREAFERPEGGPKDAIEGPTSAPRGPQETPKSAPGGIHQTAHKNPKTGQEGPKRLPGTPQEAPKRPKKTPRRPKMAPRLPKKVPKEPHDASRQPKRTPETHKRTQEAPRKPPTDPKTTPRGARTP